MLFGYVHWTGANLISVDGDSYFLDEEIEKWEYDENTRHLTYWFCSEWA